MKRILNIQIQNIKTIKAEEHVEVFLHVVYALFPEKSLHLDVNFFHTENYCNISIKSTNCSAFFSMLTKIFSLEINENLNWIRQNWIVVIQGRHGWNDYRLLAHFDKSVGTDELRHQESRGRGQAQ